MPAGLLTALQPNERFVLVVTEWFNRARGGGLASLPLFMGASFTDPLVNGTQGGMLNLPIGA
jgi:hypothetical protein